MTLRLSLDGNLHEALAALLICSMTSMPSSTVANGEKLERDREHAATQGQVPGKAAAKERATGGKTWTASHQCAARPVALHQRWGVVLADKAFVVWAAGHCAAAPPTSPARGARNALVPAPRPAAAARAGMLACRLPLVTSNESGVCCAPT